jgi:hypothetical protein
MCEIYARVCNACTYSTCIITLHCQVMPGVGLGRGILVQSGHDLMILMVLSLCRIVCVALYARLFVHLRVRLGLNLDLFPLHEAV